MEEHELPDAKWENRYYRNTRNMVRLQGKKKQPSIEGCSWREDCYKVLGQHWLKKDKERVGSGIVWGGKKDKRPLAGRAENLLGRPSSDWICSICVISFWETSHITDYATVNDFSSSGMAGGKYDTNMRWQAGSEANLRSPVKTSKKLQKSLLKAACRHSYSSGQDHPSLTVLLRAQGWCQGWWGSRWAWSWQLRPVGCPQGPHTNSNKIQLLLTKICSASGPSSVLLVRAHRRFLMKDYAVVQ